MAKELRFVPVLSAETAACQFDVFFQMSDPWGVPRIYRLLDREFV